MEFLALLRTLGALGVVLGLLAGALWLVRRYNISLPGRVRVGRTNRVEIVERVGLEGRRSLILIRRDQREHLVLIGPEGTVIVENGIAAPRAGKTAAAKAAEASPEPPAPPSFAAVMKRVRARASQTNMSLLSYAGAGADA